MQERCNPIANALELCLPCTNPSTLWSCYLHNGISYTGKTASLYWTHPLAVLWCVGGDVAWLQPVGYWSLLDEACIKSPTSVASGEHTEYSGPFHWGFFHHIKIWKKFAVLSSKFSWTHPYKILHMPSWHVQKLVAIWQAWMQLQNKVFKFGLC